MTALPTARATRASTEPCGFGHTASIANADTEYLIWSALEALHALEGQPIPQEELTALQRRVDRLTKGIIQ